MDKEQEIIDCIKRVINKRTQRGASINDIIVYKRHLIDNVWKNSNQNFKNIIIAL